MRNSVKVTVDAYEGTVTFYVFDKTDPIIKAYRKAFPDLFTDGSQMPAAIRAHLRYPEDLFKSQSTMFGRYHVTEPKRFYDGSAKWLVSPDPGSGRVSSDIAVRGERRRGHRLGDVGEQPAAGGDVDRGAHRSLLPQHPAARTKTRSTSSSRCRSCRCRRATARRASCRSSPPTPIPASTGS